MTFNKLNSLQSSSLTQIHTHKHKHSNVHTVRVYTQIKKTFSCNLDCKNILCKREINKKKKLKLENLIVAFANNFILSKYTFRD